MMLEWTQPEWGDAWQYIVLFLMAAAPWLEVFLVVPLGIAWGLNPVGVAVTGFIGNWIPILLIALFFKQFTAWRAGRRARSNRMSESGGSPAPTPLDETSASASAEKKRSKKHLRAKQIWQKYGIAGLALLAPAIVGTDIAAVLALTFGSSSRWVMLWMTVSLLLWTVLLAYGSVYGLAFVGWFQPKH